MLLNKQVFVADDDPFIARVITRRLERLGFTVESANNGLAAIAKIKKCPPALIILDLDMPWGDGFAVYETLVRQKLLTMPVIILSGRTDPDVIDRCRNQGTPYVLKGVDAGEQLVTLVRFYLTSSESVAPEMAAC